jgi:hypothetical protein
MKLLMAFFTVYETCCRFVSGISAKNNALDKIGKIYTECPRRKGQYSGRS